jgi:hypothetical protein
MGALEHGSCAEQRRDDDAVESVLPHLCASIESRDAPEGSWLASECGPPSFVRIRLAEPLPGRARRSWTFVVRTRCGRKPNGSLLLSCLLSSRRFGARHALPRPGSGAVATTARRRASRHPYGRARNAPRSAGSNRRSDRRGPSRRARRRRCVVGEGADASVTAARGASAGRRPLGRRPGHLMQGTPGRATPQVNDRSKPPSTPQGRPPPSVGRRGAPARRRPARSPSGPTTKEAGADVRRCRRRPVWEPLGYGR